jgi:TetR/AcrR family transcriptional repressor of lmrAB and yxaGH operons
MAGTLLLYRLVYLILQAMARRVAADNDSRERMLEAAIALMRRAGLSGAGINEVVRESGAPKGSVYHFFPQGKLALAAEALAIYAQRVRDFIDAALAGRTAPEDKVRALFAAFARRVEDGGYRESCAVGAVSLDLDAGVEGLRPVLADALAEWTETVAAHFDLGDAKRTRAFAGLVMTAIEGAYVRCRAERSRRPFVEAGEWLAELARR